MASLVLLILLLLAASGSTSIIPCIECDRALSNPLPAGLLLLNEAEETGGGGKGSGTLCETLAAFISSSSLGSEEGDAGAGPSIGDTGVEEDNARCGRGREVPLPAEPPTGTPAAARALSSLRASFSCLSSSSS